MVGLLTLLISYFTTKKKNLNLIGPKCAPAEILKSDWSILPCRTVPHRAVAQTPSDVITAHFRTSARGPTTHSTQ